MTIPLLVGMDSTLESQRVITGMWALNGTEMYAQAPYLSGSPLDQCPTGNYVLSIKDSILTLAHPGSFRIIDHEFIELPSGTFDTIANLKDYKGENLLLPPLGLMIKFADASEIPSQAFWEFEVASAYDVMVKGGQR